jgi:hypothetical protein
MIMIKMFFPTLAVVVAKDFIVCSKSMSRTPELFVPQSYVLTYVKKNIFGKVKNYLLTRGSFLIFIPLLMNSFGHSFPSTIFHV